MDKVALVTGSTSNIGRSIAEILSKDGFLVIVTSRHEDEAKKVAENLPQKGAHYRVDFADADQIGRLFSFIRKTYGRLDALVNNVAYTKNESILDCDLETWEYTINTNLRSYYLCTKYAAALMKEHEGGSIVNITVSSTRGHKDKFSYMVSKGGINYLTMSAAIDLAPFNIRVNAVGPGPTGTPLGHRDALRPYKNAQIPAGHIGDPSDIAHAVAFLVSEKARHIYGAILPVDGGLNISRP